MTRLPVPGQDDGTWGQVLNDFLGVAHDPDGTIKPSAIAGKADASALASKADDTTVVHTTGTETIGGSKTFTASPVVPSPSGATDAANKSYVDAAVSSGAPDATTTTKGLVKLSGDLGGTAATPTVPGLAGKQPSSADLTAIAGLTPSNDDVLQRKGGAWTNRTPAQLKTDLALVKGDVGLGNVDNTSDANKPVSTAQQAALNAKADKATLTTKGDLYAATAASTISRLGVGSDGQVLTADSSQVAGIKWSAAPVTSVVGQTGAVTGAQIAADGGLTGAYLPLAGKGRRAWRGRDTLPARFVQRQVYPAATAPTVTFQSGGNSQITAGSIIAYRDVVATGSISVFDGCNLIHVGSYPGTITYKAICIQQDVNGTNSKPYTIQFYSDSDKVEIVYINRGGTSYRVWVDDMALGSLTPVTKPTTGTFESILVDFSAAGGAKPRRYRVDLTGADLGGIFLTSAIYSIWPAEQRGPTAFFMGDSLFGGSGMSTSSIAQIPEYIGSLFGWDNVWNLGIGGTGYVAKNAPSSFDNSSLPQVQYLAPSASAPTTTTPGSAMPTPEIVVMAYGHNDTMNSTTYTAATNTFTAARSQWPNAFIIAMGPLGNGFNGTSYNAGETSIFSAVSSLVDGTLSMWQGTGRPWMYGSGKVGSTTGTSNGDIYVGTDGVHWTDAGIAFMGDHIAPELKRILTQ